MGTRVTIVCEGFAADFYGHAVPGSYFVRVEKRASGGVTVHWSDDPGQAMVFDDLAAAEAFSREDPLTLFEVSFMRAPAPPRPPEPRPEPIDLAAEMRAMGWM